LWREPLRARCSILEIVAWCAFTFGCWSARSLLLTGYPLYPSHLMGLPVSWRLPVPVVDAVARYVVAWGRWSGGPIQPVLGTWEWVAPWLRSTLMLNRSVLTPLFLAGSLALVGAATRRLEARRVSLLAIPVAALGIWFLTSPDVRFAGALFWCLPATVGWALVREPRLPVWNIRVLVGVWMAIALYPLVEVQPAIRGSSSAALPAPLPRVVLLAIDGPVPVAVPADGACWDTPPPCTGLPRAGLHMRGANLDAGYEWGIEQGETPPDSSPLRIPAVQ
jgi:hypothetical protein